MSAPPCGDLLPARVRLSDQLIDRLSQWRSLVRCPPQGAFRGACGVLLLSTIGGVLGGVLAGLLAGLLVRASFTGVKRRLVLTCILATTGGTTGGVLAAANELEGLDGTAVNLESSVGFRVVFDGVPWTVLAPQRKRQRT
jgi:hypothetical protein